MPFPVIRGRIILPRILGSRNRVPKPAPQASVHGKTLSRHRIPNLRESGDQWSPARGAMHVRRESRWGLHFVVHFVLHFAFESACCRFLASKSSLAPR